MCLIHIYIIIYWAMGPNKRKCVFFALSFVVIVVVMMIVCVLLPSFVVVAA